MSDLAELRTIPGLREVVVSEAAAQERLAAVRFELEKAYHKVADATERRSLAVESVAAGGVVSLTKIEKDLSEARQSVTLYLEATEVAERAAEEAERSVATVLRRVLNAHLSEARAERAEAEALWLDAARRRREAADNLTTAERMSNATPDALWGIFSREITAVK